MEDTPQKNRDRREAEGNAAAACIVLETPTERQHAPPAVQADAAPLAATGRRSRRTASHAGKLSAAEAAPQQLSGTARRTRAAAARSSEVPKAAAAAAASESDSDVEVVFDDEVEEDAHAVAVQQPVADTEKTPAAKPATVPAETKAPLTCSKAQERIVSPEVAKPSDLQHGAESMAEAAKDLQQEAEERLAEHLHRPSTCTSQPAQQQLASPADGSLKKPTAAEAPAQNEDEAAAAQQLHEAAAAPEEEIADEADSLEEAQEAFDTPSQHVNFMTPGSVFGTSAATRHQATAYKTGSEHLNSAPPPPLSLCCMGP